MKNNSLLPALAFAVLGCAEMVAESSANKLLILLLKPLLMPLLAWWLFSQTRGSERFFRTALLTGLVFATLGDVFMIFSADAQSFFLAGLGAFLCTHLCYIGAMHSEMKGQRAFLRRAPLWGLPFLALLVGYLYWLWPGVPEPMRMPVVAYSIVLVSMVLSVLNTRDVVRQPAFSFLLTGALLFLLSDCLIAAFKFGPVDRGAVGRLAVMGTYLVGQGLLVWGAIRHLQAD